MAAENDEHFAYALQLVTITSLPMALHTVIKLGVLDTISESGPDKRLSASEIVARLGFPNPDAPDMLDRILRLLASYSIVTCSLAEGEELTRVYGLAPAGKFFVRNEDGVSLGPLLSLIQDKVFIDSWFKFEEAVIEGGVPFDKVHGTHVFGYSGKDPRFNEVFNRAMINHTTIVLKEILRCYRGFGDIQLLVDVGGGLGVTLGAITSKYPNIKGINFDLPHVIQHAPPCPGVQHIGGDMLESVPKGDAIFIKWILHDWSDNHCLKLLKNCYEALPEDGKVVVVEQVLPVLPNANRNVKATSQIDVLVMTICPGGKERTEEEFLVLAKGAGFAGIKMECCPSNFWVMEFFK